MAARPGIATTPPKHRTWEPRTMETTLSAVLNVARTIAIVGDTTSTAIDIRGPAGLDGVEKVLNMCNLDGMLSLIVKTKSTRVN